MQGSWIEDRRFWGPKYNVPGRTPAFQVNDDPNRTLADALDERGLAGGVIGVSMSEVPVPMLRGLEASLPQATLVDATDDFNAIRMVKTAEEIRRLRGAVAGAERGQMAVRECLRDGMTGFELAAEVKRAVTDERTDRYIIHVSAGALGSVVLAPTDAPIRRDSIVSVDVGSLYEDYCGDMFRVYAFGDAPKDALDIHERLDEVNETLVDAVRPGVLASELYELGVRRDGTARPEPGAGLRGPRPGHRRARDAVPGADGPHGAGAEHGDRAGGVDPQVGPGPHLRGDHMPCDRGRLRGAEFAAAYDHARPMSGVSRPGGGAAAPIIDFERFEWVSFDCYGTLVDWETGISTAVSEVLESHGVRKSRAEVLALFADAEPRVQGSEEFLEYRVVLRRVMAAIGAEGGIRFSESELDCLSETLPRWPVFPEVVEALNALQMRCRLAVISNVDDDLFAGTAKALGVDFDAVVTAQQVRSYKPSLRNFHAARERMGVETDRWLHVAESLYHDIGPANRPWGQVGLGGPGRQGRRNAPR